MSKCIRALLMLWLCVTGGVAQADPQWVAHASAPGPDQPAAGGSRFDQLFAGRDNRYRIPYPFSALVASLEAKIDNGAISGVRQVFIPLGRSLQRNAPAPEYFRYPRAVIALQGEPLDAAEVLEYRLFIAHQPSTESLEIISYNDLAGRFEFQVVEDYAAGRQPRVRQANRLMCLGCHQNAAAIFPARPWSETTFNVEIAGRLTQALPQRFESLIGTLTADAGAIDLLAERANYLAAAQLIWRQGCSDAGCRAAALRAVLQYRLSSRSSFARDHAGYRRDYYSELARNWRRNWPEGLALGNSRLVDRNPLAGTRLTRAEDPLALRPAHATWREADAIVAEGIIYRLGGFLTHADIRRLDDHLVAVARRSPLAVERFAANCRLANVAAATRLLECSDGAVRNGLQATIELEYRNQQVQSMHLLSLRVPGDPSLLQTDIAGLSRVQQGLQAGLKNPDSGLSTRLANGDRLAQLRLHWQDESLRGQSRIEIEVSREFQLVERALAIMLQRNLAGDGDSLSAEPFRRQPVIAELGEALGLATASRDAPAPVASPTAAPRTFALEQLQGDLALLEPFCGHCHSADTRTPPGFLAGDDAERRVSQCAARILARLMAWHAPGDDSIAPMPPPATIPASWADSNHYRRLLGAVTNLLAGNPAVALPKQPAGSDYDRLPPCLAPG